MHAIRCPQCGTINQPDDVGFPRCGQCHDDLVRCSSCRHFEDGACRHARAAAGFTPDLEAAKTCDAFRSQHEVRTPRMLWNIPAPVWVSALLLVMLLGTLSMAWFIDPVGRFFYGNPLRLETVVPRETTVGHPSVVTLRVTNLLDQASTRIYIEIGEDFLARAKADMPYPEPVQANLYRNRLLLEYPALPANGQLVVQLPFTPREAGLAPFVARIFAPTNQLRQEVHVPIVVMPDMGPVVGQKEEPSNERAR